MFKGKKRGLIGLLVVLAISLFPAGGVFSSEYTHVTILGGGEPRTDFTHFGVWGNRFTNETITEMSIETGMRMTESINASLLVIFGEQTPPEVYEAVFTSAPITRALTELLRRGGMLYFGPTSGAILRGQPASKRDFFAEIGAFLIGPAHYRCKRLPGDVPRRYAFTGIANPEYESPFTSTPHRLLPGWVGARSIIYFANLPEDEGIQPLLIEVINGKQYPLAILQEGIVGEGKILFTYIFSTLREPRNAFMENILVNLYGERRRLTLREERELRLGIRAAEEEVRVERPEKVVFPVRIAPAEAPEIDGVRESIWDLHQGVTLSNRLTGAAPERATRVQVLYDAENLYLFYTCFHPTPHLLKTEQTGRDGSVWTDDSVEFFISEPGVGATTYQLIISAAGVIFDSKDGNSLWNFPDYQVAAGRGEGYWTVELSLPFSLLHSHPQKPPLWKVLFGRSDQQLEEITSWVLAPRGFLDPTARGYLSFLPEEKFLASLRKERVIEEPPVPEGVLFWYDNPFRRKFADTLPEDLTEIESLSVTLAQNEKESTNVLITNFNDRTRTFRVEPSWYVRKGERQDPFETLFTLKEAVPRLSPHMQLQMDPLVRLNEGNLLTVPAFETRQLWIDVYGNLPPGDYTASISFVPVDHMRAEKKVEIKVSILPLVFPECIADTLGIMTYLYGPYIFSWARPALKEAYYGILPQYHINWAILDWLPWRAIKQCPESGEIIISRDREKYLAWEHLIRDLGMRWIYTIGGVKLHFNRRLERLGSPLAGPIRGDFVMCENWKKLFTEWVTVWFSVLREEGIGFDEFMITPIDEVKEAEVDNFIKVVRLLREIEPEVRIKQNVADWATMEMVRRLNPYVDFWVPWETRLTHRSATQEAELAFFQEESARPFASYLCAVQTQVLPLLSYYRFRGIRNWLMEADGIVLWSFNSWRGNSWAEFDTPTSALGCRDNMLFYHGCRGPIPSIRVESFREGIEDLYLLHLAEEALIKAPHLKGLAEIISRTYLEELMKENDPDRMFEWRETLMHFLVAAGAN